MIKLHNVSCLSLGGLVGCTFQKVWIIMDPGIPCLHYHRTWTNNALTQAIVMNLFQNLLAHRSDCLSWLPHCRTTWWTRWMLQAPSNGVEHSWRPLDSFGEEMYIPIAAITLIIFDYLWQAMPGTFWWPWSFPAFWPKLMRRHVLIASPDVCLGCSQTKSAGGDEWLRLVRAEIYVLIWESAGASWLPLVSAETGIWSGSIALENWTNLESGSMWQVDLCLFHSCNLCILVNFWMILQAMFCILCFFFGMMKASRPLQEKFHFPLVCRRPRMKSWRNQIISLSLPVTTFDELAFHIWNFCWENCGAFVFDDFDLKGARGRCLQRWTRFHRNCSLLLKAGSVKSSRLESTSVRDQCRHFAAKADDSEAVKIHWNSQICNFGTISIGRKCLVCSRDIHREERQVNDWWIDRFMGDRWGHLFFISTFHQSKSFFLLPWQQLSRCSVWTHPGVAFYACWLCARSLVLGAC